MYYINLFIILLRLTNTTKSISFSTDNLTMSKSSLAEDDGALSEVGGQPAGESEKPSGDKPSAEVKEDEDDDEEKKKKEEEEKKKKEEEEKKKKEEEEKKKKDGKEYVNDTVVYKPNSIIRTEKCSTCYKMKVDKKEKGCEAAPGMTTQTGSGDCMNPCEVECDKMHRNEICEACSNDEGKVNPNIAKNHKKSKKCECPPDKTDVKEQAKLDEDC